MHSAIAGGWVLGAGCEKRRKTPILRGVGEIENQQVNNIISCGAKYDLFPVKEVKLGEAMESAMGSL